MRLAPTEPTKPDRGSTWVIEALEATRRAMRRCRFWTSIASVGLAVLGLAVVVAVADVSWTLPYRLRAAGLLAMSLAAVAGVVRASTSPALRYFKGDAAAAVEASFPELGQRVRTTLEYAEPTPSTAPASASMVEALAADTDRQALGLEFPAIVPWRGLARRGFGLAAAIAGTFVALALEPTLRIAAARLFLRPDFYSTLAVEPGDTTIKVGSDFTLKVSISGRAIPEARWLRRPIGGEIPWDEVPLAAPIHPGERHQALLGTLEAVRKDCREDFEYRVVAGELEGEIYRVKVIHPLVLRSIEADIEPPTYTRRGPSLAKEGNFRVPEWSRVRFRIELDRAPKSARLVWNPVEGEGSKSPMAVELLMEGARLSGELPKVERDVRYEVVADASDGMKLEPTRYLIKVQPDEKPTIRFLKPAESFAATPTTEVPVLVEAADDYGLTRLGIVFQVNDEPEQSLYLDEPAVMPAKLEALATLFLEKYPLTSTDSLTYRAFVEDNRSPIPWKVSTELRYLDILPYKQSYQMSEGQNGPPSDGTSLTLEELIARQRQTLSRTFAHIDDRPVDPEVADRLAGSEGELTLATEEFARALASEFGLVSPLDAASRSMAGATARLSERDVVSALPLEQSALASLVQARKNLRKLLSDSKSAGQCRKFDRQQQQKLRKPPAKDKSQEAELAKLEQDVRRLAEGQKKFAEEIEPKGGGGPKFDSPDESKAQPSKPAQAGNQPASAREANRLKALAAQDPALTDLARSRMEEAARQVNSSKDALEANDPDEAARSARSAAEQLERLADQVAGLKPKELAAKLAKARDIAQATAKAERALAIGGKPDASAAQLGLAEQARTLADLLRQATADATEENRVLSRAIGKAMESNSPTEIEQNMRQAASAMTSGSPGPSAEELEGVAGRLEALARDLEAARRDLVQPRLDALLALEKRAAEVERALQTAHEMAQKDQAVKALGSLAGAMNATRPGPGPIQDAADALDRAAQSASAANGWLPPRPIGNRAGLFTPPVDATNAVRGASRALQAKIQELIRNDSLVDRDGAVPPGYKELVEDYFRLLSEDQR